MSPALWLLAPVSRSVYRRVGRVAGRAGRYYARFTAYCRGCGASTGISTRKNLSIKSIVRSTSLSAKQMGLPKASSCLITRPVTRSVLQMQSLPKRWLRVFFFFCAIFSYRRAPQIPSVTGRISQTGHACVMAPIPQWANHNHFIFWITTPNIQGGLRGWSKCYEASLTDLTDRFRCPNSFSP